MKKLLAKLGTGLAIAATPAIAFAQAPRLDDPNDINLLRDLLNPITPNPSGSFDLATIASRILSFIILIAAIIAIVYLLWAGIRFITSGGDETKVKNARSAIYNSIIGIVIIIFSYAIIVYISRLSEGALEQVDPGSTGGFSAPGVTIPGRGF